MCVKCLYRYYVYSESHTVFFKVSGRTCTSVDFGQNPPPDPLFLPGKQRGLFPRLSG